MCPLVAVGGPTDVNRPCILYQNSWSLYIYVEQKRFVNHCIFLIDLGSSMCMCMFPRTQWWRPALQLQPPQCVILWFLQSPHSKPETDPGTGRPLPDAHRQQPLPRGRRYQPFQFKHWYARKDKQSQLVMWRLRETLSGRNLTIHFQSQLSTVELISI